MFGNRYFGNRFFGDRYFGPGASEVVVEEPEAPRRRSGGGGFFVTEEMVKEMRKRLQPFKEDEELVTILAAVVPLIEKERLQ